MSNSDYHTTAVSIGDLKNGMLYFDTIIPATLVLDLFSEFQDDNEISLRVMKEIIPESLMKNELFSSDLYELTISGHNYLMKLARTKLNLNEEIEGLSKEEYNLIEYKYSNDYFSFINKYGFESVPLLSRNKKSFVTASMKIEDDIPPSGIVTLSNLKIIDASKASWEQLIEFRKDREAKIKLRRLRLFAYENYTGKSKDYVEDDISTKIYDYEVTTKKFGLELIQATVNNVMNSKHFTVVTAGSIITALFAAPPISLLSASAGAVIELGQFVLEFKRQKYEFQNLVKDNPASFITYINEKIE